MAAHDLQIAYVDRFIRSLDDAGLADRRRRLLDRATGRVLDVGSGPGPNLPLYRDVDRVVALEPDPAQLAPLEEAAGRAHVPVDVVPAGIDDAELEAGSFDTVVCTLVLCTVPDLHRALRRIHRLLAPDGRLLFLEHVRVPGGWGHVQRWVTPVWKLLVPGCHLDRDPIAAMRETNFVVTDCEHFTVPILPRPLIHAKVGRAAAGVAIPSRRDRA
jgi:SAM-dependent methyltransferase